MINEWQRRKPRLIELGYVRILGGYKYKLNDFLATIKD